MPRGVRASAFPRWETILPPNLFRVSCQTLNNDPHSHVRIPGNYPGRHIGKMLHALRQQFRLDATGPWNIGENLRFCRPTGRASKNCRGYSNLFYDGGTGLKTSFGTDHRIQQRAGRQYWQRLFGWHTGSSRVRSAPWRRGAPYAKGLLVPQLSDFGNRTSQEERGRFQSSTCVVPS